MIAIGAATALGGHAGVIAAPPPATGLRVLVIDDVPVLAEVVASLLELDGHRPAVATTAEAARAHLQADAPDVILCDLALGEGASGWDLAEYARQHAPTAAFVLLTGWAGEIVPDEARRRGVRLVLAKPCRAAQLRQALATLTAPPLPIGH